MGGIAVPGGRKARGRKTKKGRATRPSTKIRQAVYEELLMVVEELGADVDQVMELLQTGSPAVANKVLGDLQEKWRAIYGRKSESFARKWVGAVSARQKEEFQANMARALGVDYTAVFDDKIVFNAADLMSYEAGNLIKNMPEEFLAEIRSAVMTNYQQLPLPEGRSLLEQIQEIGGMTKKRAYTIARDQTSKIHSAITQARHEEIGIEEYIWRTAGDSRVVGNPAGHFPKGNRVHGNHFVRNGKTFYWANPPEDGHPGYAINCRCVPLPIIDIAKLKYV